MLSYEQIRALKEPLETEYEERHEAHRRLRDYWHGRYWERTDVDTGGIASIFRDLTSRQSDIGPDIKLVYNLLKDVCVKFQTFLSPLPMIRMYVDPPESTQRRHQATLKERYLYALWSMNTMSRKLADTSWYLPLMGDSFLGIFPDIENNTLRPIIRSPEFAYPLQSFDMDGLDGVIFCWKAKQSAVKRMFPDYQPDEGAARPRGFPRRPRSSDPEVEIIEYSDRNEWQRFAGTQRMNGVEHSFGFDLYEQVKFITVPGEVWGHGAVEQAVNLVEMGNAYLSLMMQSAIENVFPTMVLIDPQKAPEEIERGGGAVVPVNAGGDVKYLVPPGGNMFANAQWGREIERMIQTDSSMPEVNFGQFQASIVTGKAINELQGAGSGSLVEMVQGVSMGAALVGWNEKAIQIGRTMFADERMHLYGTAPLSMAEINPRHFAFSIKGSQLVGSTRNEVVFMPHLDMHSKVVMGLQLAGAGLVSKQWQREQVGIPDSEAMEDEIIQEAVESAVVAFYLQTISSPDEAAEAEKAAQAWVEGGEVPGVLSMAPPTPSVEGAPPLELPTGGAPPAELAAGPGQQAASPVVTVDEALRQLGQVNLRGEAWLVGEIVATGQTVDPVTIMITDPEDRAPLTAAASFETQIRVVEGQPSEPWINIATGAQGGEQPSLDMLAGATSGAAGPAPAPTPLPPTGGPGA